MAAYRGSTAARRQPAPSCRDIDPLSSVAAGASGVQASASALAQSVGLRPAQLARLQEACAGHEGQTPTDDAR
jgi:hypothetical protein